MMMMMIGDPPPSKPTVHIPPWDYLEDQTVHIHSPSHHDASLAALQRFLPSNKPEGVVQEGDDEIFDSDFDFPGDAFSCDDFRMFEFKVRMCTRARSHDWTECPFAHPGEKARRRDPRRYHYSGSACPDFRRGACGRGDACEHAHGVFECWLHPSRYRTQPCKDGIHCRRRVCFFAHTPEQFRVFPHTYSPGGSPRPTETESFILLGSSLNPPLFISPPSSPAAVTPPASPAQSLKLNHLTESMRGMQISKLKMSVNLGSSPTPSWGLQFGSPRCPPTIRPGFTSLPSTPIRAMTLSSLSPLDAWGASCEEEPAMERVESGKALREKIYEKIGQENSLDWVHREESAGGGPDFGWVSELVM